VITPVQPEFDYRAEGGRLIQIARLVQNLDLRGIVKHAPAYVDQTATCELCAQHQGEFRRHEAELAELLLPFQARAAEIIAKAVAIKHAHDPMSVTLTAQEGA
jgi:hypothetical protein